MIFLDWNSCDQLYDLEHETHTLIIAHAPLSGHMGHIFYQILTISYVPKAIFKALIVQRDYYSPSSHTLR